MKRNFRLSVSAPAIVILMLSINACVEQPSDAEPERNAASQSGTDADGRGEPDNDTDGSDGTSNDADGGVPAGNEPQANDPDALENNQNNAVYPFFPESRNIAENRAIFFQDGYAQVNVIRADVRTMTVDGVCTIDDDSGCTLDDVIADINRKDDFTVRIPVHFSATDFADDGSVSNAQLRQRGGTTRLADQKSFTVRLNDKNNLWRGERSLLLNKHPYESSRIRNKLAFDLMSEIPHLMSSRTQFVNLWIDNGSGPVDFGLFTHVEAAGGNYLEKRGLNRDDRLYKVENFRFSQADLENVRVDADGKPLDRERFEQSLDIEAGKDHRPLVAMLSALQDPDRSFESVLEQYFNRNNVLTWMATNVLLHQTDAVSHNFILYNPLGTETFYFLPWDYDGGFVAENEPPAQGMSNTELQQRLQYGYARGIVSDFHTAYFRLPGIHDRLVAAAEFISENYLTTEKIMEKTQHYDSVVRPFITRAPDINFNANYNPLTSEAFALTITANLEALRTRFAVPMPPTLDMPVLAGENWVFSWDAAYDVTGNDIEYELIIASSPGFEPDSIVYQWPGGGTVLASGKIEQRLDRALIPPGQHFARVIARSVMEPERFWQVPTNQFELNGSYYFGLQAFGES